MEGPPPGTDLSESRQASIYGTVIALWLLSTIVTGLRFLARRITHLPLWWDDWFMLLGYVGCETPFNTNNTDIVVSAFYLRYLFINSCLWYASMAQTSRLWLTLSSRTPWTRETRVGCSSGRDICLGQGTLYAILFLFHCYCCRQSLPPIPLLAPIQVLSNPSTNLDPRGHSHLLVHRGCKS